MDDLISREAALEALRKCQTYLFEERDPDKKIELRSAEWAIEDLPSAHPELDKWCTDCKEYDHERHCCPRYNRVIREALAEVPSAEPKIIYCKDCRFARLTDNDEVKYCDVWSPDDKVYMDAKTNFCSFAERREG